MLPLTYQQGFHNASECIRYRNPYRPGTSEFDNFERGFFQARKRGIKPSRFFRRIQSQPGQQAPIKPL